MKRILSFILLPFLFVLNFQAFADSASELELSDLVRLADRIDVVRCTDMKGYWQGKNIVTDNQLLVLKTIKSLQPSQQLVVTTLGGTAIHPRLKAPVNMTVPGGADFSLNQETLIFTKQMPNGQYQLIAFSQGMFAIDTDATSGKRVIPVGFKVLTNEEGTDQEFLYSTRLMGEPGTKIGVRNIELDEMIARIQKLL